jgi:hypothetical protein
MRQSKGLLGERTIPELLLRVQGDVKLHFPRLVASQHASRPVPEHFQGQTAAREGRGRRVEWERRERMWPNWLGRDPERSTDRFQQVRTSISGSASTDACNYFPYYIYILTSIEAASMDALPYSCQRQSLSYPHCMSQGTHKTYSSRLTTLGSLNRR